MAKATAGLICGLMLILGLSQIISGHKVHKVGDYDGWNPNVDYKSWAAGKTFYQGDFLEFIYGEGLRVQEVTARGFETCDGSNALFEGHTGRTVIPLNSTGNHYFICDLFDFCTHLGMKLNIHVNRI